MMVAQSIKAVPYIARVRCKACQECGSDFTPQTLHAEFCSTACRKGFNNRRAVRGAELYDLFMTLRYDRKLAAKLKVWKLLCRMAMGYRREDQAERAGRKSWGATSRIIAARPYLQATTVASNIMGARLK